jgi:hypothetical protein
VRGTLIFFLVWFDLRVSSSSIAATDPMLRERSVDLTQLGEPKRRDALLFGRGACWASGTIFGLYAANSSVFIPGEYAVPAYEFLAISAAIFKAARPAPPLPGMSAIIGRFASPA